MTKLVNQNKWNLQKLLMLIQYIVTPIWVIVLLVQDDWSLLEPKSIFIVSQDLLGIIICTLLFMSCVKDRSNRTLRTSAFAHLVSLTAFEMFLSALSYLLPRQGVYINVHLFIETMFQVLTIIVTLVFMTYLVEVADIDTLRVKKFKRIIQGFAILDIISVLCNIFGHYYFYINEAGDYVQKPLYALYLIFPIVVTVLCLIFIIRMKVSASQKRVLISFITMPQIGIIIYYVTGISVVFSAFLCALIFIYGNVFAEQETALVKSNLEVASKENELLRTRQEHIRVDTELNLASEIQTHIMPRVFPPFPEYKEFDIYATMDPAKEVGGDFYDFFLVDEDHLGMVIADVSGKGVPAALYMMVAKTMIKNAAMMKMSPSRVLEYVNEQLCEGTSSVEMFVTVWYGIYEISTGRLTAANGGHEYPVLRRPGGQYEIVKDKHGLVLGGIEGIRYKEYEMTLEPGSTLFVYTDGVPEATDEDGKLFEIQRMLEALNQSKDETIQDMMKRVRTEIDRFVDLEPQFDDITMLALHVRTPEEQDTQ